MTKSSSSFISMHRPIDGHNHIHLNNRVSKNFITIRMLTRGHNAISVVKSIAI